MKFFRHSRPRFWMYVWGPVLIGIIAARSQRDVLYADPTFSLPRPQYLLIASLLVYASYPANILIYGVNDIADHDTDIHNEKKTGYEHLLTRNKHSQLIRHILSRNLPFLVIRALCTRRQHSLDIVIPARSRRVLLLFVVTSVFYSLPPLRAKQRPFVDGITNILYLCLGLVAYAWTGGSRDSVSIGLIISGWLRCMAMHCYSAIPDIAADTKEGLTTTAVLLGKRGSLIYCALLWAIAAALAGLTRHRSGYVIGLIYIILVMASLQHHIMTMYRYFPWINTLIGMLIFRVIVITSR